MEEWQTIDMKKKWKYYLEHPDGTRKRVKPIKLNKNKKVDRRKYYSGELNPLCSIDDLFKTGLSKKEYKKIKKEAKRPKRSHDLIYDSSELELILDYKELGRPSFYRNNGGWDPFETRYQFEWEPGVLHPGMQFKMNGELFECLDTNGNRVEAKKIMTAQVFYMALTYSLGDVVNYKGIEYIYDPERHNQRPYIIGILPTNTHEGWKLYKPKKIMKKKKHKIGIPEDHEMQSTNSYDYSVNGYQWKETHVVFTPIKKPLPKTWEEYCKTNMAPYWLRDSVSTLPKRYDALGKLEILRDVYNDGWKPDYKRPHQKKWYIGFEEDEPMTSTISYTSKVLTFKTHDLCVEFLTHFRSIIETAKPLL